MHADGCPHCGAPYLRTASTDEDLTGQVSLPTDDHAQVCYQTRLTREKYFGFTLYFHPATVHVVELRTGGGAWEGKRVFASAATAEDERAKLERVHDDATVRVREIPLREAQTSRPPISEEP